MYFDLPLDQLLVYKPERDEPSDFDAFWKQTLLDTQQYPINASFCPIETGLMKLEVYDVTFNGYAGQPIKAWMIMPRERQGSLPCVVEYCGYGAGRGLPCDWLVWSSVGYAHFIMDIRGQGSEWLNGDTPDSEPDGGNAQIPGFMTRGILKPETYYYRRVFMDAVRAVEAARTHPSVVTDHVVITGVSQGGGIALAVAGLLSDLAAVLTDVPFLSSYKRATEITDTSPYDEISRYLLRQRDKVDIVFNTLRYFDVVNFAPRAHAPALFSVGLMDEVCPPSTVFSAFNHYAGEKEIRVWQYNRHEGGGNHQVMEKIKYLNNLWH